VTQPGPEPESGYPFYPPQQGPGPYGSPQPNPYEQQQYAPVPYGQHPVDPRLQSYPATYHGEQRSRVAAGLFAIFLGSLGVHNFYLGRTGLGVLQLLLSLLSLGFLAPLVAIWALVEGILILVGSPSYATDRRGIPLRG
jgi:hypothetical protein